jgi:hypothetical protein
VEECLQVLAPQRLPDRADSLEGCLRLLLEQLRARRVLLVLDNLETLLEEGTGTGRMRAGFEGYARLLQQMGESRHQSCLLLTSREKPADLVPLEGSRSPVRALRLAGLDGHAGAQLLAEKDVVGSPHDRVRLVEVYRGNPLALKIVAQTIVELFGGEIVPFLEQGECPRRQPAGQRELGWHRQAVGGGRGGKPEFAPDACGAYRAGASTGLESGWRHAGQWQL